MRRNLVIVFTAFILFSGVPTFADDEAQETPPQQTQSDNQTAMPPAAQNPAQIVRPSGNSQPSIDGSKNRQEYFERSEGNVDQPIPHGTRGSEVVGHLWSGHGGLNC